MGSVWTPEVIWITSTSIFGRPPPQFFGRSDVEAVRRSFEPTDEEVSERSRCLHPAQAAENTFSKTQDVLERYRGPLSDRSCRRIESVPFNDGMRYLLTCIDVFSKRAWAVPDRTKSGRDVTEAFERVLDERECNMVQSDKGSEFLNSTF